MGEYVQAEISLNETTYDLVCELIDVLRDRLPERPSEEPDAPIVTNAQGAEEIARLRAEVERWKQANRAAERSAASIDKQRCELLADVERLRAECERLAKRVTILNSAHIAAAGHRDEALARADQAERALAEARAADGEATALLRELDAAKEERDEALDELGRWRRGLLVNRDAITEERDEALAEAREWKAKLAAAEAREKGLREALVTYGRHNTACDVVTEGATAPCDCGLDDALARDGGEESQT